jgi:hypothetical protein
MQEIGGQDGLAAGATGSAHAPGQSIARGIDRAHRLCTRQCHPALPIALGRGKHAVTEPDRHLPFTPKPSAGA